MNLRSMKTRGIELAASLGFDPQAQGRARARLLRTAKCQTLAIVSTFGATVLVALGVRGLATWAQGTMPSSWAAFALLTFSVLLAVESPSAVLSLWCSQPRIPWRNVLFLFSVASLGAALLLVYYAVSGSKWENIGWGSFVLPWHLYVQGQELLALKVLYGAKVVKADEGIQRRAAFLGKRLKLKSPRVSTVEFSVRSVAMAAYVVSVFLERVFVSRPVKELLSPEELDFVLAHELAHKRQAPLLHIVLVSWTLVGSIVMQFGLPQLAGLFGLKGGKAEALPVFILLCEGTRLLYMPLAHLCSRALERRADRTALRVLERPEAAAKALVKLYDRNEVYAAPGRTWQFFFGSHPTGVERVQNVLRWVQKGANTSGQAA